MKKKKIIPIVIAIIIIIILIFIGIFSFYGNKNNKKEVASKKAPVTTNVSKNTSDSLSLPKPLFTDEQKNEYYKISTAINDIGLPSDFFSYKS